MQRHPQRPESGPTERHPSDRATGQLRAWPVQGNTGVGKPDAAWGASARVQGAWLLDPASEWRARMRMLRSASA